MVCKDWTAFKWEQRRLGNSKALVPFIGCPDLCSPNLVVIINQNAAVSLWNMVCEYYVNTPSWHQGCKWQFFVTLKTLATSTAWQTKGTISFNSEMRHTFRASQKCSNGGLRDGHLQRPSLMVLLCSDVGDLYQGAGTSQGSLLDCTYSNSSFKPHALLSAAQSDPAKTEEPFPSLPTSFC